MKIKVNIFDPASIESAIAEVDRAASVAQGAADDALLRMADEADAMVRSLSPVGPSGDYMRAHKMEYGNDSVLLWNDVQAVTAYDEMYHNPLRLRMSYNSGWVGEHYADAVEFGYQHGTWPLWKNSQVAEGYRPYTQAADYIRSTVMPQIRAEFSLD